MNTQVLSHKYTSMDAVHVYRGGLSPSYNYPLLPPFPFLYHFSRQNHYLFFSPLLNPVDIILSCKIPNYVISGRPLLCDKLFNKSTD